MYTNQYRVNGNLVFYDDTGLDGLKELWVDAIGRGVIKDLNHFTAYSADEWTITGTVDGDVYTEGAQGSILVLEVGAVDDARSQVQRPALPFKLTASDPLYFGCRWRLDDATECDVAIGLCSTDGSIVGGVTDGVYFRKTDDADTIFIATEKDSTETETTTTISAVDDAFIVTEFYWDGVDTITAYVNGVLKVTQTTNIPDDEELAIAMSFMNGSAAANYLSIDWVRCIQCLAAE